MTDRHQRAEAALEAAASPGFVLEEWLRDPDRLVRTAAAAGALRHGPSEPALAVLIEALDSADSDERLLAVQALGRPEHLDALRAARSRSSSSPQLERLITELAEL